MKELAGGEICGEVVDIYPNPVAPFPVTLTYEKIDTLIGKHIPADTVKSILDSLEIKIVSETEKELSLQVPTYRVDVQRDVDVIEDLTTGIMNVMGIGGMTSLSDTLRSMIDTAGFTMIIFILIYLVLIIMLYMKFLMRGAEIFIVRMGFPLACVGIIDANGGVFSGYVNKLFQIVLSVTVQVVLCKLSLSFMIGGHLIWAIVFAITAVNSPRILQELIYNPGGGGGGGITQTYYIAQMIKGLAKKG